MLSKIEIFIFYTWLNLFMTCAWRWNMYSTGKIFIFLDFSQKIFFIESNLIFLLLLKLFFLKILPKRNFRWLDREKGMGFPKNVMIYESKRTRRRWRIDFNFDIIPVSRFQSVVFYEPLYSHREYIIVLYTHHWHRHFSILIYNGGRSKHYKSTFIRYRSTSDSNYIVVSLWN